jgi:sulfatase modifying factor 1
VTRTVHLLLAASIITACRGTVAESERRGDAPLAAARDAEPLDAVAAAVDAVAVSDRTPPAEEHGDGADAGEAVPAADGVTATNTVGADGFMVCGEPPAGMVCVPGGAFRRGNDGGRPEERPAADVTVSTFYIDRFEVTNAEFLACMEAGACRLTHHYDGFHQPDQPVVAVNWINAAAYCAWVGERLPTEAEWEKAARGTDGRTYPWGEEPPTCERAHYRDCEPRTSRPVGSFAPGPWGIHDMAGNAYEFVQDWYAPCYAGCPGACGDACTGTDPRGPCGGAERCPGYDKRVLRGGSWFWEADQLRTTQRRGMRPASGGHRLGFRCAVDAPLPGPVGAPPVPAPPVAPLDETQRAIFLGVPEEQLTRRPVDVRHWVQSNESDHDLWFATIDGLGGGYVGVGSDQNYSLFARARSSFVWLMDYDFVVTQVHRIYRALILASVSPEEFLLRWDPFERKVTLQLLAEVYSDDPELAELQDLLQENADAMGTYLHRVVERIGGDGQPGSWLADRALYRYVRRMFQEDRVRIVAGDLLREMPGRIAEAQRELGVPLRIVYLSNAEEYFAYNDSFRTAFTTMPFDERSVVLRTVARRLPDGSRRVWHYQVEPAAHFVAALAAGTNSFADLDREATYGLTGGLSWLGLAPP